jgi:hypothetical protein
MTFPFQFPVAPHVRRHGPRGYRYYSLFRPWLRDEFSFRCVYCLRREQWEKASVIFHIDHFYSVIGYPNLINDYDNLLYCCAKCNLAKCDRALPNPLDVLTSAKVRIEIDGTIHADVDSDAARLIELLGLDSKEYTEFRKVWIDIISLAWQKKPELYQQLMCYPEDLPNLRRRKPPAGNTRPGGVEQSAFARRERGELPAYY